MDNTKCWGDRECCIEALDYARSHPIRKTRHFNVLRELLFEVLGRSGKNMLTLLDIGCGAASLQDTNIVKECFEYNGLDSSIMIESAASILYPDANYIECDMVEDDTAFTGEYDVIVMNAFIDVMESPIEMISKILFDAGGYVIIHRQRITDGHTMIETHSSYGGETLCATINKDEFLSAIDNSGFMVVKKLHAKVAKDSYSFLLVKK